MEYWKSKESGIIYQITRKDPDAVWYLLPGLLEGEHNCAADIFYAAHEFVGTDKK